MKQYNLCFLGFGNVGRALARLLVAKSAELREQYGIEFRVTGGASRRLGWLTHSANGSEAFEISNLLANPAIQTDVVAAENISEWLRQAQPDAVFETTSL